MLKNFNEMRKVNVLPYCEKREGMLYLNWAKCIDLLHENGAENVYFVPIPNERTGGSLYYSDVAFTDKNGVINRTYETALKSGKSKSCGCHKNDYNKIHGGTRTNLKKSSTDKKKQTYTIKSGDCLWNIAKKFYGSGADWKKIYDANKTAIEKAAKKYGHKDSDQGDWIFPGTILTIP